ncbi:sulfite exporter TauE/SafE family protein [Kurthia senegalensis]|uniref:sulfite exporter TauE/SafE family protein n=1 Tax=Kurthia senegalensis TaxID=1033740 RepID=UPI0002890901|nr:sulfite exporter TauE/SafE family protein [Kurthia senegalensis]
MEITYQLIIVLVMIGFVGSLLSGMLGMGGAIIKYPLLLFVPPLFGLAAFSAHQISGMIAVEVFFSAFIGMWAYRKDHYIHKQLTIYMGSAIVVGSLIGSFGSSYLSTSTINIIYGILALLAAVLMFLPKKKEVATKYEDIVFHKPLAMILAFIVGIGSGIVGAGGGFLIVPIMLTILNIPTRITLATSLAITFISSIGGSIGKLVTGQVEYIPVLILIVVSFVAAPLGVKIGKAMNTKYLRIFLAILISATAVKIWIEILFK